MAAGIRGRYPVQPNQEGGARDEDQAAYYERLRRQEVTADEKNQRLTTEAAARKERDRISKLTPAQREQERKQNLVKSQQAEQAVKLKIQELQKRLLKINGAEVHIAKNTNAAVKLVRYLIYRPTFDLDVSDVITNPKESTLTQVPKGKKGIDPYSLSNSGKFGWLQLMNMVTPQQKKRMDPKWLKHVVIVNYSGNEKKMGVYQGYLNPLRHDSRSFKYRVHGNQRNLNGYFKNNYKPSKGRIGKRGPSGNTINLHEKFGIMGFKSYKYKFEIYINPTLSEGNQIGVFVSYIALGTTVRKAHEISARFLEALPVNVRYKVAHDLLNLQNPN